MTSSTASSLFPAPLFLVLLLLSLYSSNAAAEFCTPDEIFGYTHQRGVCGPQLMNTMKMVCRGRFFNPYYKRAGDGLAKRSIFSPSNPSLEDALSEKFAGEKGVFLDKKNAIALLSSEASKRNYETDRPTLVCECCVNQCTMDEMLHYCSPA